MTMMHTNYYNNNALLENAFSPTYDGAPLYYGVVNATLTDDVVSCDARCSLQLTLLMQHK